MATIKGTVKFELYLFRARAIRRKTKPLPKDFVYKQDGRIWQVDENGKKVGNGKPFGNYGELINFVNRAMRKAVMKDLKAKGRW